MSSLSRTAAILDLTARNAEGSNSTSGLKQSLDINGIPYIITDNVDEALQYGIIFTSSYIAAGTLTTAEEDVLRNYVSSGGVLVSTSVSDPGIYDVFGISESVRINTRHTIVWQTDTSDSSLKYINDPNEQVISLGSTTLPEVIYTRGYGISTAQSLAKFEDGSGAVTVNQFGSGKAYSMGFSYTDLIIRNGLNLDYSAQRTYSNGFEPATDTIMLFLRGIYERHIPYAVWKHTSPAGSDSVLMITHDVDSQSSMDYMGDFANLESALGIATTYNVTTHYIDDAIDDDFYTPNIERLRDIVSKGQKIGSHSVGHFQDFHKEDIIPEGSAGNSKDNYSPYYDGTVTTGGTVYGEIEVSKQLLEADLGVTIKTFRSGHLLFNDYQINCMDALGYEYDSSFSANDVLTSFPYLIRYDRSLSGIVSNVYEMPVIISDDGIDDTNWNSKVANWLDIIGKNADNYAPTVLLIHPNREYKIDAEESLINQLPDGIEILDMDTFGDYWRERDRVRFRTEISSNTLILTILDEMVFPVDINVSIFIRDGKNLPEIVVQMEDGSRVQYAASEPGGSDIILYGFFIP